MHILKMGVVANSLWCRMTKWAHSEDGGCSNQSVVQDD